MTFAMVPPEPSPILLYDGVCGLCDRTVQFFVARDRAGRLRYAPLQGETAAELRREHPEIPEGLDTIVLVEGGRAWLRSHAVFRSLAYLPGWRWVAWLRLLPRPLTDLAYRLVARVRYRIWGRFDACRLPAPEQQALFLP